MNGASRDGCSKNADRVDPERLGADRRRPLGEDRQHPVALGRLQPLGQRHVKAEVVEDVRVAVAQQMAVLARRQAGPPAGARSRRGRAGPESLERLDAVGRKRLRAPPMASPARSAMKPPSEPTFSVISNGARWRANASDRLIERIRRPAVGQRERRLQRAMKAVVARRAGDLDEARRVDARDRRLRQRRAVQRAAEPAAAERLERGAWCRREVDRAACDGRPSHDAVAGRPDRAHHRPVLHHLHAHQIGAQARLQPAAVVEPARLRPGRW